MLEYYGIDRENLSFRRRCRKLVSELNFIEVVVFLGELIKEVSIG